MGRPNLIYVFADQFGRNQCGYAGSETAERERPEGFREMLAERMASSWYRDHWTDGDRNIVRAEDTGA